MSKPVYLAVDGDDVGRSLEYLLLTNQDKALCSFSHSVADAVEWLSDELVHVLGAELVFKGGDNILCTLTPSERFVEETDAFRRDFHERTGCTISIGLGTSAREAYIALKFAKASGKDRMCTYGEVWHG